MLSDQQADKLLKANVANLRKKLLDGKTLTHNELELIEKEKLKNRKINKTNEVPEFAKTITELAELLEVPRKVIYDWRVKPGAPSTEKNKIPVGEWLEWMKENTRSQAVKGISLKKLTIEYKEEQVRNLKIKNEQLIGDLISKDVVSEIIEGIAFLVREEILKSGMPDSAKTQLFDKLNKRQHESIEAIIAKNKEAVDNAGETEPGAVG